MRLRNFEFTRGFEVFCILTKKYIAFAFPFVYNVTIRVSAPTWKEILPERSKTNHVHC